MYQFKRMSKEDALSVCSWQYVGEYAVYNYPSFEELVKQNTGMGNDKIRTKEFYSIFENEYLVGHFRLHAGEGCLSFGIGMKPESCGQGRGKLLMDELFKFIDAHYHEKIRLLVRPFNQRALKTYLHVGFKVVETKVFDTPNGKSEFIVMEKQ